MTTVKELRMPAYIPYPESRMVKLTHVGPPLDSVILVDTSGNTDWH